jgi:hypothetical protein
MNVSKCKNDNIFKKHEKKRVMQKKKQHCELPTSDRVLVTLLAEKPGRAS